MPEPVGPSSPEASLDGYTGVVVHARSAGTPEFSASTDVFYVNGIQDDLKAETTDAQRYADLTHDSVRLIHVATTSLAGDVLKTAEEKLGKATDPPEAAVTSAVMSHVSDGAFAGDVHFYAHSRGALVVQRGLEQAGRDLKAAGLSPAQITEAMSHVSVETAGGASLGMPAGVRCVNYVDPKDAVANLLGQGEPSRKDVAVLDAVAGATFVLGPAVGAATELGVDGYLVAKPYITHPNGPVVAVPTVAGKPGSGAIGELVANHKASHYLDYRRPFEAMYAAQTHGSFAADVAENDPNVASARRSETSFASRLATPGRPAQLGDDVRAAIERLAASGGPAMPQPVAVTPDAHRAQSGTFVRLDDATVALHTGRGNYEVFDVARDLGGHAPPIGRPVDISANGVVRDLETRTNERA